MTTAQRISEYLLTGMHHTTPEGQAEIERIVQAATQQTDLAAAVRKFFDYLDRTEDSEMTGREFHPVTIGCCRAMWTEDLNATLAEMKRLSQEPTP